MAACGDTENDSPGADSSRRAGSRELYEADMLTKVQQVGPAKGTDKKPPTREISRTEKKSKGFLKVLVETMDGQKGHKYEQKTGNMRDHSGD